MAEGPGGQSADEQCHEPSHAPQQDAPSPKPAAAAALSTSSGSSSCSTEESSSLEGKGLGGSQGPQQEGSPVSVLPRQSLGDIGKVGALAWECVASAVRPRQSNCCATMYDSLQLLLPHIWLQWALCT